MKCCVHDYHDKPMWYGRGDCLNKVDFAEAMKNKREGCDKNRDYPHNKKNLQWNKNDQFTKDFKITLTTMTSPNDFKDLTEVKKMSGENKSDPWLTKIINTGYFTTFCYVLSLSLVIYTGSKDNNDVINKYDTYK